MDAINLAGMCTGGVLPVAGGLLEQSSWFLDVWQTLQSEENRIEIEKAKAD